MTEKRMGYTALSYYMEEEQHGKNKKDSDQRSFSGDCFVS